MSLVGIFHGIGDEIGDDLMDTGIVENGDETVVRVLLDEFHTWLLHTLLQRFANVVETLGKVHFCRLYTDATSVERRDGKDIVDQSHEHVAVVHNDVDDLLLFLLGGEHGQHV